MHEKFIYIKMHILAYIHIYIYILFEDNSRFTYSQK